MTCQQIFTDMTRLNVKKNEMVKYNLGIIIYILIFQNQTLKGSLL